MVEVWDLLDDLDLQIKEKEEMEKAYVRLKSKSEIDIWGKINKLNNLFREKDIRLTLPVELLPHYDPNMFLCKHVSLRYGSVAVNKQYIINRNETKGVLKLCFNEICESAGSLTASFRLILWNGEESNTSVFIKMEAFNSLLSDVYLG
jgi:hypothetical protein